MANKNLGGARRLKNDEFYTQYADIEKEVRAYLEYNPDVFRGKTILCNCDDPYTSNFFKFFALEFNSFGLKRLIASSYDPSPIAGTQLPFEEIAGMKDSDKKAYIFDSSVMPDLNKDGVVNLDDTRLLMQTVKKVVRPLEGNGDFRSRECVKLLEQADIVVTNPPFSLFREYLAQLVEYGKQFLIIGNMNAITYKEVFPLFKANKMWLGATGNGADMVFAVPKDAEVPVAYREKAARLGYIGNYTRLGNSCWYTNLEHGRRHDELILMTMADNLECSKHKEIKGKAAYEKYGNYDAIEVPYTDAIPSDYPGVMGVPISFLDKYCPEQFEIIGGTANGQVPDEYKIGNYKTYNNPYLRSGEKLYQRILIRHKLKKEQL